MTRHGDTRFSGDGPGMAPRLPAPEVWAEAARRETGRDLARDAAVRALDPALCERPVLETLALAARRHPGRAAFLDRARRTSYGAFWNMVAWQADAIRAAPSPAASSPAGPVAILAADSMTQIAAQLACLGAGRPSVVLDPAAPAGHGGSILAIARPAVLALGAGQALGAGWRDALPAGAAIVSLDGPPPRGAEGAAGLAPASPAGLAMDAPAFLLPTSGSTGQPKLIVHSQRSLAYIARLFTIGMGADDHFVSAGGVAGSYSTTKYMLATLFSGASMHFANLRQEGYRQFLDRLAADRASVLRTGASVLRIIAALPGARAALAHLRAVRLGGEPTSAEDLALFRAVLPAGCRMHNTYGASECIGFHHLAGSHLAGSHLAGSHLAGSGPGATVDDDDADGFAAGFADIGGQAAVVDDDAALCRPGTLGEVVIRSRYNALGEWQDGRCVAGRLIPDPDAPGWRVYHTGDLGRTRADGCLVIAGRKDRMLNINGQRIDPAEVEAAIRATVMMAELAVLPRVRDRAVTLVAFVVPAASPATPALRPNPAWVVETLRAGLRERLPERMRPSRIVVLDALPRLANGKVDAVSLLARLEAPRDDGMTLIPD